MSESSNLVGIEPFIAYPINRQSAGYGFRQNSPLVEFRMESQSQRHIDGASLRLNGRLRILREAGKRPNNNNAASQAAAQEVLMDDRVSVNSLIDILRLRNLKSQSIEEIRNYARLISSLSPVTTSYDQYKTHMSMKFAAPGNQKTMGYMCNQDILFSIPLNAGLFASGDNLNLADLGGLVISVMLNNDAQVLYGGAANENSGAFYNIQDVSLTGSYFVYSKPVAPKADILNFPCYNSFMTILNSGDDSQSLNLSQRSVRSLILNTIPSERLNNYSHNGYATPPLINSDGSKANILEYTFMKGSIKFPKQYSTDERNAVNEGSFPVKKERDYLDSVRGLWSLENSLISPYTTNQDDALDDNNEPFRESKFDRRVTGLGCRIDGLSNGQGSSYMNDIYTLRIISQLDGQSPNSCFLFTLSNQAIKNSRAGEIEAIQ